jgi:hypothetical protein
VAIELSDEEPKSSSSAGNQPEKKEGEFVPPARSASSPPCQEDAYREETCRLARKQFHVSIATLVILAIYTLAAAYQACEMRKATEASQKSADAATKAAGTAQQANNDAENRFRMDERPYVWFTATGTGAPEFIPTPNTNPPTGQIVWSWHYTDYGKTPAYGIQFVREEIRIGKNPFKVMLQRPYRYGVGTPVPPGKDDFATILSEPGFSQAGYAQLLSIDRSISIRVRADYVDAGGSLYETGFCLSRLANSVLEYCEDDNYIKKLSDPN